jgi:hypothetical protein
VALFIHVFVQILVHYQSKPNFTIVIKTTDCRHILFKSAVSTVEEYFKLIWTNFDLEHTASHYALWCGLPINRRLSAFRHDTTTGTFIDTKRAIPVFAYLIIEKKWTVRFFSLSSTKTSMKISGHAHHPVVSWFLTLWLQAYENVFEPQIIFY